MIILLSLHCLLSFYIMKRKFLPFFYRIIVFRKFVSGPTSPLYEQTKDRIREVSLPYLLNKGKVLLL